MIAPERRTIPVDGDTDGCDIARQGISDRRVIERFFEAQMAGDVGAVLGCWHRDGVMSTPYAPSPLPRTYVGREAVGDMFSLLFRAARTIEISSLDLTATDSPGLWLATWEATIELHHGALVSGNDIGLVTMRDGAIATYVEYFDPIPYARAFGLTLD